jgi:cellulose synthase/poly-beta-1,6-N-acetylglucosamine synthase-like glycosyltransferase
MTNVTVLIPAHNEGDCIASTLKSVAEQSAWIHEVWVVADNCTDDTAEIARAHHAHVMETVGNRDLKAGALNQMLGRLLPSLDDDDLVLIMDADSHLTRDFVRSAIQTLRENPDAGAICATYGGEDHRRGMVHVLQRAEYSRCMRTLSRKGAKATVLSGVATLFTMGILREILAAREAGTLPAAPGVYDTTCSTEDIEITFAVRKLGYSPIAPKACFVWTDTMNDWRSFISQRIRWQRGMLDALRLYGWTKQTNFYIWRMLGIYVGSFLPLLYLGLLGFQYFGRGHITIVPLWLLVIPLFIFDRWWTVRRMGWREKLVGSLLFPEWCYDVFRSGIYWFTLWRWVRRTERVWIPT